MSNSKAKAKGPIRTEAVVPFILVCAAFAAYFKLFFDTQLRWALQWGLTHANGAQVDVAELKTSFTKGTLRVAGIEATDPEAPRTNRVSLREVGWELSLDALLRGKLVIERASIEGIQSGSPRKTPGRVIPPSEESSSLGGKVYSKFQDQFAGSALADIGRMLEGFDPSKQLGSVSNLKSVTRIEELQKQLAGNQAKWAATLASLPSEKDFGATRAKLDGIRLGGGPAEIAGQVQQLTGVVGEASQQASSTQQKAASTLKESEEFGTSLKDIDRWVEKDRADLESRIKLPRLDAKGLSEQLFGPLILGRVAQAQRYFLMARAYLPASNPKAKKPVVVQRGRGRTYEFAKPRAYPSFWLKTATLSGKATDGDWAGDFTGEAKDFTSQPALLGQPAVVRIQGDFPKQNMGPVKVRAEFDHTLEVAEDSLQVFVGRYAVQDLALTDSPEVRLGLANADASSTIEASLKGALFTLQADAEFRRVDYRVSASSKVLESNLKGVLQNVPAVTLQAKASGSLDDFKLSVESNLGSALQQGFEKQLQGQVAQARKLIEDTIQKQVGPKRAELNSQWERVRTQVLGPTQARTQQADSLVADSKSKLTQAQNQATATAPKPSIESVKGKFGF